MNSSPSSESDSAPGREPARQALTDALLREHARLGTADDESLLAAVRARTVERPLTTRVVDLPMSVASNRSRTSAREWMQMAAAVTVTLALVGLFLSRPSSPAESRSQQTFQLVSRPLTAVAVPSDASGPKVKIPAPSALALGEFVLPGLEEGLAETEGPTFSQGEMVDPASVELLAEFSVSAEKILQVSPDHLVYEGGVVLHHPDFTLEADRLELSRQTEAGPDRVEAFVARGNDVKVEKRAPGGGIEVARATSAAWDAQRGGLILAGGPPTLSVGSSFVRPVSTDGVIVLRSDGFQVIER